MQFRELTHPQYLNDVEAARRNFEEGSNEHVTVLSAGNHFREAPATLK